MPNRYSKGFMGQIQSEIRKIDDEINIIHKILHYQNVTAQKEKELDARYSFLLRERRRLDGLITFDEHEFLK